MFMIIKKGEEEGISVVKCETNEKLARELVKQISNEERINGLSSVRATAFNIKTGITIAGPGMLGAENGKTAKKKARMQALVN
jgi:hypothetical protein